MVLVGTSVWIQHFRYGETVLAQRLSDGLILMLRAVCGNLKNPASILSDFRALPATPLASYPSCGITTELRVLESRQEARGRGCPIEPERTRATLSGWRRTSSICHPC